MQIRPFDDLYREATAYHVKGAELLKNRDTGYQQYFMEADRRYKDLLRTIPDHDALLFLRGTMDLQTGDSGRAIALLEKCVRLKPDQFDAWNNLGAAWRQEHQNEQARKCYEEALKLRPEEADILANLCAMSVNEGHPEQGIVYGERCLAIDPNHPQGRWNLALLYLENEQYDKGFTLYNQGFETGDRIVRKYVDKRGIDAPFWCGPGSGRGGTIVLHGEQGRGDELLWMQFAPFMRDHFERVIIDCHPTLCSAIRRSFPWATVYPTRKEEPVWAGSEHIDFKQSVASLPQWFHERRGENSGWLKPDLEKVETVRKMIREGQKRLGQKGWPVIGIHWIGGRHRTRADLRSVHLEEWGPIFDLPVTLVSHQYTKDAFHDAAKYPERILHWQALTGSDDLDWNIALVAACDLLISINTTAIHIAGAMGKDCWTLTPTGRAWRYSKATAPETMNQFYKTVKQYNQARDEPWKDVMQRVAADLEFRMLGWEGK